MHVRQGPQGSDLGAIHLGAGAGPSGGHHAAPAAASGLPSAAGGLASSTSTAARRPPTATSKLIALGRGLYFQRRRLHA